MLTTPSRLRGPGGKTIEKNSGIERPCERAPPGRREEDKALERGTTPQPQRSDDGGDGVTASCRRRRFNFPKRFVFRFLLLLL